MGDFFKRKAQQNLNKTGLFKSFLRKYVSEKRKVPDDRHGVKVESIERMINSFLDVFSCIKDKRIVKNELNTM